MNENKNFNGNINFVLTPDQAATICKHFGVDVDKLEEFEICELLDRLIDEVVE